MRRSNGSVVHRFERAARKSSCVPHSQRRISARTSHRKCAHRKPGCASTLPGIASAQHKPVSLACVNSGAVLSSWNMSNPDISRSIDAIWRIEAAQVIASLARMLRDVGLAEEFAQDALVIALEQWPRSGIPDRPGAWLLTTARHRAID